MKGAKAGTSIKQAKKKAPYGAFTFKMCEEGRLSSAANLANGLLRRRENAAFKWHEIEAGSLTLGCRA